jgi:uncharacterized protein YutE (UPF0331/DUF86 family)
MKLIGFVTLLFVLIASLFKLWHADLTNNVLGVALMVLLLSLFSDLRKFNFWGLTGEKKEEKELEKTVGKDPISPKNAPKAKPADVTQAQKQTSVPQMDTTQGNFLALAFEIERLLRVAAAVLSNKLVPPNSNMKSIVQILRDNGLLNENGEKQIELITWLRNMLVHGRSKEVSAKALDNGFEVAKIMYTELQDWLGGERNGRQTTK